MSRRRETGYILYTPERPEFAIKNSFNVEMPELLVATNNAGKLRELRELIREIPVTLVSLSDVGIDKEIAETGATFEENAAIKASGYARLAGIPTLADDSGLMIDHLGGSPGVHSARYASGAASDAVRIHKVLSEMKDVANRTARFVCVIVLADADGRIVASVKGTCEGMITDEPRGSSGFGYDPIFLPDGFGKTFAQLDALTKNLISHRADAVSKIIPFLRGFFLTSDLTDSVFAGKLRHLESDSL